ncbi:unnamed protein product [Bursaphelenchus xylophilus]|uniref:(pine wood nematode) hypothetical protein n=1 Tax=Bursaphelenchus xylophilus TaxID=6326 RepID=A0A1I7SS76_BURXY|nr:unnamed protein product [Bursaphelenchus xylophilus]CAG9097970.1 unnamed protein product [Bursaphelenchus xylophilus]
MGKPYRVKVRSGRSKSRLPKGTTSSSNPTVSRFRDLARAQRDARKAPLIAVDDRVESLNTGEDLVSYVPINSMSINGDSSKSMISEGGMSRLTSFTNCTNATFAAVHREWRSGSHLHSDVIAVLAAVAQAIKERNGSETDEEYFMGLLAIIDVAPLDEVEKLAAASYLFYLVIKKMPKEYLIHNFGYVNQVLCNKITKLEGQNEAVGVKFLLSAMGHLLRAMPLSTWKQQTLKNSILLVIVFSVHDNPAVRTISRKVTRSILTDPVTCFETGIHPAAKVAGEKILADLCKEATPIVLTRLLCLLEGILHKQPEIIFTSLTSQVLELATKADPMVRCAALQCVHRTLQRQPSDSTLSILSNERLVGVLRSFPVPADTAVCAYWLQAFVESHICLAAKDQIKNEHLLGESMEVVIRAYHRGDGALGETIKAGVSRIIQRCIQQNAKNAVKCLQLLDMALLPNNTASWHFILLNIAELFEEAGSAVMGRVFDATLQTLAELRERDTAPGKPDGFCSEEIEAIFGAAVRHVDLERVIKTVSLGLDMDQPVLATGFKRSWLLLVFKGHIKRAPLAIFTKFFLPLAISIHSRVSSLDGITKKLYTIIEHQIWDLLPGFLSAPVDFDQLIHQVAPILGAALNERPDLRLRVLAGIRAMLKFVSGPDSSDESAEIVRRYAKNFLPLLFLHYTTEAPSEEEKRQVDHREVQLSALETIRLYIPYVPDELIGKYADAAIQKINDANSSQDRKLLLMDILVALTKAVDSDYALKLFETIKPFFSVKTNRQSLQKKAYRVLSELYSRLNDSSLQIFFEKSQTFVEDLLANGKASVAPSSWAARLVVFKSILNSLKTVEEVNKFTEVVFDQVVMCLDKSRSQAVRHNAVKCFQDIVSSLLFFGNENEIHASQVLDGLVTKIFEFSGVKTRSESEPLEKVRATLIAYNVLAQTHLKDMNAALTAQFLQKTFLFLKDRRSPIRVLAIRLIRIFCKKMPEYSFRQYQDLILDNIFNCQTADENTVNVRRANKVLFTLLIDIVGVEVLCKYANKQQGWGKFLRKLDKTRRKKLGENDLPSSSKSTVNGEDDGVTVVSESRTIKADSIFQLLEDSDDEGERDTEEKMERRSAVWIRENVDDEDDVVDLLDRKSVLNKIVMEKPKENKEEDKSKKKSLKGFRFASDGRFVIDDEDQSDKKKRKDDFSDDDDDDDQEMEMDETNKSRVSVSKTKSIIGSEVASEYTTGGKGIHRNLRGTLKGGVSKKSEIRGGKKVEPYAYIPLRQKHGRKVGIKNVVKNRKKKN